MDNANTYNVRGGPRTDEGRANSSRNATKHGCCSEATLIIGDEKIEDYLALEATWFKAYRPKDDAEISLIHKLINAEWFLERATRTLAEIEDQIFEQAPYPLNWTDDHHLKLARFLRYQTARANAASKARKEVEAYRKNRMAETHKAEKHEMHQEKSRPEPCIERIVDEMRDDTRTSDTFQNNIRE